MTTALACAAILGGLLFLLGWYVSVMRGVQAKKAGPQYPTDPADRLFIAIRAHGNAAEYIPTLIVLFLLVALREPGWWATTLIVTATAARVTHAVGLITVDTMDRPAPARLVGAMGTYLSGIGLAITLAASL